MRSHYLFESCERKNTYRNSKVEGMEENHFHTTVIFLSFAIYLLSQGPFKDELWSICFCLVPFSWFMNIYIKKIFDGMQGWLKTPFDMMDFVSFLHYFFLLIIFISRCVNNCKIKKKIISKFEREWKPISPTRIFWVCYALFQKLSNAHV